MKRLIVTLEKSYLLVNIIHMDIDHNYMYPGTGKVFNQLLLSGLTLMFMAYCTFNCFTYGKQLS